MSDNAGGNKQMYVGKHFANSSFYDYLGNREDIVLIDENGIGKFPVNAGSVSAWIKAL